MPTAEAKETKGSPKVQPNWRRTTATLSRRRENVHRCTPPGDGLRERLAPAGFLARRLWPAPAFPYDQWHRAVRTRCLQLRGQPQRRLCSLLSPEGHRQSGYYALLATFRIPPDAASDGYELVWLTREQWSLG